MIYRCKGNTPNEEFNTYDNASDLIDKIKNGEMKLAEVKNKQNNFRSNLGETKRGSTNSKDQNKKKTKKKPPI